jgi:hypothetical protein
MNGKELLIRLKQDMVYKLAVYAAYLPESVLNTVGNKNGDIKGGFEYGKDPISVRDDKIKEQENDLMEKVKEINELKQLQEKEFVPRITKEKLEDNLKTLEVFFK